MKNLIVFDPRSGQAALVAKRVPQGLVDALRRAFHTKEEKVDVDLLR